MTEQTKVKTFEDRVKDHFPKAYLIEKQEHLNAKMYFVMIPTSRAHLGFGWSPEQAWKHATEVHGF